MKPYDWKDGVLSLREKTMALQKKSNPYKVFDLLERNFFEKVSNEALQKTISGNLNDVTSAISYLRERIREAGLSKFVKIKATGKGGYLLEIS